MYCCMGHGVGIYLVSSYDVCAICKGAGLMSCIMQHACIVVWGETDRCGGSKMVIVSSER